MKRWVYIGGPVALLFGLIAWRLTVNRAVAAAQVRQRETRAKMAPPVTLAVAHPGEIVHAYEGIGTVEAPFNVKIAAKVGGRIDFLEVREGDRVTRGQALV